LTARALARLQNIAALNAGCDVWAEEEVKPA
jgi:hypothetical protein